MCNVLCGTDFYIFFFTALKLSDQNIDKIMVNRLSEKPLYLISLADLLNSCYEYFEIDQVVEKCTELKSFRFC